MKYLFLVQLTFSALNKNTVWNPENVIVFNSSVFFLDSSTFIQKLQDSLHVQVRNFIIF